MVFYIVCVNSDSSAEELSNDEDSSAPEQSEVECESGKEETDKAVTFVDGGCSGGETVKPKGEHKTVTLQVCRL